MELDKYDRPTYDIDENGLETWWEWEDDYVIIRNSEGFEKKYKRIIVNDGDKWEDKLNKYINKQRRERNGS